MKLTKIIHSGYATFTTTFYDADSRQPLPPDADPAAFDTYAVSLCSEDGTAVQFSNVGMSEYATCSGGHRWQFNFNPGAAGWVLIDEPSL